MLVPPGPGLTPLLGLAKDGVEGWWLTRAGEAWPLGMQGVKPSSSDLCTLGGLEPRKQKKDEIQIPCQNMRAEQNLVMAPQTIASTPLPSQKDINFPRYETLKKSKAF